MHWQHIFIKHVVWPVDMCDMTHSYVWPDSIICATWLIHNLCDMTHSCVTCLFYVCFVTHSNVGREHLDGTSLDLLTCVTWPIDEWHDSIICAHDSFICVTWLIHMCGVTFSDVCRDSFTCVAWTFAWQVVTPIDMCDMTHSCVTWLIHLCDVTHTYVCRDPFMCNMAHSYVCRDPSICVTWRIQMCDMTHSHVWYNSCICVTWLNHVWHMCDVIHLYR